MCRVAGLGPDSTVSDFLAKVNEGIQEVMLPSFSS